MAKTHFDIKTMNECFKEENRELQLGGFAFDRILGVLCAYSSTFALYLTKAQIERLKEWTSDSYFEGALNEEKQTYKGIKYFIKGDNNGR